MRKDLLTKEDKEGMIKEIQTFFLEERDEKIGIIAAGKILDLFAENLARRVYDQALYDAKEWFTRRLADLEIDYELLYRD
ncbi:MAG: DUF2164 domain-containing protein [Halanaerobium sp.]|nr:DUF2164 domain-containing protein [Halanaerobium sp.]